MHVACPCKSHLKPSVAHPQQPLFLSPPSDLTVHELLAYGSKGTDAGVWPSEREFWPFWVMFAAWSEWQCLSLYWLFPRGDCKSRHESHSTDDEQFYGQSQSKMVCGGVTDPELVPNDASTLSAFKKTADATRSWLQMRWVGSDGGKGLSSIQVFPLDLLIKAAQASTYSAGKVLC